MADSENRNPWVLNFQKLGLEFKCPLWSCIPGANQFGADCPVCKAHFVNIDLRNLPFMENMLTIYKCLDATFSAKLFQPAHSEVERVSMHSPASSTIRFGDKMSEELRENAHGDNSRSGNYIGKQVGVDENGKVENRECKRNDKGIEFSGAGNPNLSSPRSHMRGGGTEGCKAVDMDINPVPQSSPDIRRSFGRARGSDNDSNYRCSEHRSENSLFRRSSRGNNGSVIGKISFGFEKDGNFRGVKRQKQLNYGPAQLGLGSADHIQSVSNSGALMTNLEPELPTTSQASVAGPKVLDGQFANETICAFCYSSEISEDTGTMLHFSNGKSVVGYEATLPNVIHAHKVCVGWAPRVYYVDDRVKNLKEEVARGAKLKCSGCGKKGAALGCYVRSCRRSYHAPCAMKVPKCRWAYEDYLMLCPDHSSVRFPNEKSKSWDNVSKVRDMPSIVSCPLSNSAPLPDGERKLFFCGSALSAEEKILLVKFGTINGATVSKFWNPNVTHVIVATNDVGACTRTFKFLMAILTGKWIVKVDWIKACMGAKCHVNEEPYEVSLDNYGCRNGPLSGRGRASKNAPKLFSGLNFYFAGDFLASHKEDLQDLVIAAGGTVLKSKEELVAQSGEGAAPTPRALAVYNDDPPEGCRLGEEVAILFQRLSEAEDIAFQTGSKVIGHTWLLESIAGHKLQEHL
ncbi:Protein BREAST CANCER SUSCEPTIBILITY 1-like protein [Morus notabilis]|uniref:Protein BREAST CANCER SUSCEPTIBILITY 1-like protein n=1 Tax=Morus notabilis TaxID=981085 RepID=W9QZP3_9ROSA|nr:Protein BREAST CANCER SUSCEPTIBILITY 1-like protein [Morus notabilis]